MRERQCVVFYGSKNIYILYITLCNCMPMPAINENSVIMLTASLVKPDIYIVILTSHILSYSVIPGLLIYMTIHPIKYYTCY